MSEDEAAEFDRFESLARKVVNTPKPKPESADVAAESADDDAERERPES